MRPLHRALSALLVCVTLLCVASRSAAADEPILYRVGYDLSTPSLIHVWLNLSPAVDAPLTLIIPRSAPGAYEQTPYDPYVANVKAYGATADAIDVSDGMVSILTALSVTLPPQ